MREEDLIHIVLCHDCTLELFRSIPKLRDGEWIGRAHSVKTSSPNYPLCCEYSWSFEKDENGQLKDVVGTKEHFKPQQTFNVEEQ